MGLGYRIILILGMVLGTLLPVGSAQASCGLDYCALPTKERSSPKPPLGNIQLTVRHVNFTLNAGKGSYQESLFRFEIQRVKNWRFGGWIAPVRLSTGGQTHIGISSPVAFAERKFRLATKLTMVAAMQLEFPFGDSESGIASSHAELLPYVGIRYDMGSAILQLNGGFGMALGEQHSHNPADDHGTPVFVNPHEDKEALLRVAASAPFFSDKLRPGIVVNVQMPVGDASTETVVTGSLTAAYQVTESSSLRAEMGVPLATEKRFDWRASAGVVWIL